MPFLGQSDQGSWGDSNQVWAIYNAMAPPAMANLGPWQGVTGAHPVGPWEYGIGQRAALPTVSPTNIHYSRIETGKRRQKEARDVYIHRAIRQRHLDHIRRTQSTQPRQYERREAHPFDTVVLNGRNFMRMPVIRMPRF
jgi:hypothetical protein